MLEKEKVTQGIYLDLENNNKYWVESRDHAEIFKKYGTVEDLTKNPRFKKVGKITKAHCESFQKNILGLVTEISEFGSIVREHTEEKISDFITNKKTEIADKYKNSLKAPGSEQYRNSYEERIKEERDYILYIEKQREEGKFKNTSFENLLYPEEDEIFVSVSQSEELKLRFENYLQSLE